MDTVLIALAFKAQSHAAKAMRMDDKDGTAAMFCAQAMIDRLGRQIDAEIQQKDRRTWR